MKIFEVELNPADHKNNSPETQEAIFAHLPYWQRKEAVKQLRAALEAEPAKAVKQAEENNESLPAATEDKKKVSK